MEELRRSISLRSYGQRDPLQEYKAEAYRFFEELMNNVRLQVCTGLFRSTTNLQAFENMLSILSRSARLEGPEDPPPNGGAVRARPAAPAPAKLRGSLGTMEGPVPEAEAAADGEIQLPHVTVRRDTPKVGRNDPCPCGSGKKYKHCHGK